MKYIRLRDFEIFLRDLTSLQMKYTESEIPIWGLQFAKICVEKIRETSLYRKHLIIERSKSIKVYMPVEVFKALTSILEDCVCCNKVFSEEMKNDLIFQIHKSRGKILNLTN